MKLTLSLCCAVLTVTAAHAQILRPEMAAHHRRARTDAQVVVSAHPGTGGYGQRHNPSVYAGIGYGHRSPGFGQRDHGPWSHYSPRSHGRGYGYYSHRPAIRIGYGYHPGYDYGYYPGYRYGYTPAYDYAYYPSDGYSSYGAQGLFWGGLAGAIIGHNSGAFRHDAWRGAAWGAGAGWLLGTIADANRRAVAYQPAAVPVAPVAAVAPQRPAQPVTIINNYYNAPATPMSAANGLFGR